MQPRTTVIIPSRNEPFLHKTVDDVVAKATGPVEVYAILDGWWPDAEWTTSRGSNVHFIHWTEPRGQRAAYNAGAELAKGEFLMFLDAHVMLSQGFDDVLVNVCRENWVCVPTRKRLDAENWTLVEDSRPDINYLYLDPRNDGMNFLEWREKNRDKSLDALRIDDILACQGSCYFLRKDYFEFLEVFDEANYGTFRKDPQELCFKAWTSGGRVVRVKDAWYAHLHKGKRYGRGYSTKTFDQGKDLDYAKGDEYVKRWYNNTAWDSPKRVRGWAWLMSKFNDMPGWEKVKIPEEREKPVTTKLPNTYQVLKLPDGSHFTRPRSDRETSKFWNEGRWHTFVEPLLPEATQDMTFVEMGANAGLYLKMASDHGFGRVVGVEKDKTPVKIGKEWRDRIGGDWALLKRKLGGSFGEQGTFDLDELPVADVTLMSCWHYYIPLYAWLPYLDRLAAKTCNVIVVSRPELDGDHWLARADFTSMLDYFGGWYWAGEEVRNVQIDGDSSSRDLYSVCFISPHLERWPISDIQVGNDRMAEQKADLASLVARQDIFDPMQTAYADAWRERKASEWSERTLRLFVEGKVTAMKSVRDDGLKEPIIVDAETMKLHDGGHRLAVLKALGHQSVIVRPV